MEHTEITSSLRELLSNNMRRKNISDDTRLSDLNVDSMTMVALTAEIEEKFSVIIDPSVVYDLNNIKEIAGYISQELNAEMK